MLPLGLWRQRVLALCNLGGFGASATYMAVSALLPTYVQGAMGYSAGVSGFVVGAASVSWMVASIVAGRLMVHTSYRLTFAIGGASLVAGSAVLLMLDAGSGVVWPVAGSVLIGNGMGFCNTTFIVAIQGTVAWRERGVATGSQMFMRMIGMSVGAALFGAIVNFGVHRQLPGVGDSVNRLLLPQARGNLGPEQIARLADAIAAAAQGAFLVATLIAAGTLVLVFAFPARPEPDPFREG